MAVIRRNRRQRGSSLIEFTLVLLPLMAMLLITIDLGWLLFAWASIQEAVREGVRFAVTGQTGTFACQDAAIQSIVEQYSFGFVNSGNVNSIVSIQYFSPANLSTPLTGAGSNAGGNVVKISISNLPIQPLAPLWRSASPLILSASSSDIMEGSPNGTPPCR